MSVLPMFVPSVWKSFHESQLSAFVRLKGIRDSDHRFLGRIRARKFGKAPVGKAPLVGHSTSLLVSPTSACFTFSVVCNLNRLHSFPCETMDISHMFAAPNMARWRALRSTTVGWRSSLISGFARYVRVDPTAKSKNNNTESGEVKAREVPHQRHPAISISREFDRVP